MSANDLPVEDDRRQVADLCDDLQARVETARTEEALLDNLVDATVRTHPYRSRQYRSFLATVQARYQKLRDVIGRYCGRGTA
jgi:hypothetical protein